MKTIITTNPASQFGYQITFDGQTHDVLGIVDDGKTLKLPENPSNRKYYAIKKVIEAGGTVELTYKETKVFGPKSESTTKTATKGWYEYLTDEEKEIYNELKAKAERRAQMDKIKAQIAALEAQLAEAQA